MNAERLSTTYYYGQTDESVLDKPIYHYMELDCLLQLLNDRFYVGVKQNFNDAEDAGNKLSIPVLNIIFPFNIVGGPPAQKSNPEFIKFIQDSKKFLASCWTFSGDDNLMWDSYTSRCGVCIQSTIKGVASAFEDLKEFDILCSKMEYESKIPFTPMTHLFYKNRSYRHEEEVRFYFLKKEIINQLLEKETENNTSRSNSNEQGKVLAVNHVNLIDKIILSPKMNCPDEVKQTLIKLNKELEEKIQKSKIKII